MSAQPDSTLPAGPPLDLSRWRNLPNRLIAVGAIGAVIGLALNHRQFGYSWLTAFMFFLSLGLGSLFLVIVHHLFDAGWSVPIRRFCEHISTLLFPWMAVFFIPIAILAPQIYGWMKVPDPAADHALHAKFPLYTMAGYYLVVVFCFGVWAVFSNRLRYWSMKQDTAPAKGGPSPAGGARLLGLNQDQPSVLECTLQLRKFACVGIFFFAVTLTLAAIMWMQGLMYEWFSTMYGVYYFAGSVWMTLGAVYFITMLLKRTGKLGAVLQEHQFYFIGSLMFAFTVFYAYIAFSQYFIIWNANLPEETFWYLLREKGTWWYVGLVIIFGHFFVPFLALIRIDAKLTFGWMIPICAWMWVMHYLDLAFNIHPFKNPNGYPFQWAWLDLACSALIGGVLLKVFLKKLASGPAYPVNDPRLAEAMGHVVCHASPISGGEMDETDELADAPRPTGGGR